MTFNLVFESEWEKREHERQLRKRKVLIEGRATSFDGLEPNARENGQRAFPGEPVVAIQLGTPVVDEWRMFADGTRAPITWSCDFMIVPAATIAAGVDVDG